MSDSVYKVTNQEDASKLLLNFIENLSDDAYASAYHFAEIQVQQVLDASGMKGVRLMSEQLESKEVSWFRGDIAFHSYENAIERLLEEEEEEAA